MLNFHKQIIKFGVTGVVNTLIDFALFNLLVWVTGIQYGWQLGMLNMVAVLAAASNSYLMNRRWTFQSADRDQGRQIVRFVVATGTGMLINSLVVAAVSMASSWFPLSVYLLLNAGKLLGALFSATWNFITYRGWVFTDRKEPVPAVVAARAGEPGLVSIVIPAFNEERRLPARLRDLAALVADRYPVEILVVDDGSTDGTARLVTAIAREYPFIHLLSHPCNRGKGAAVRTGMLAARGQYRLFTDADNTFTADHIDQIIQELKNGHQVAIGCRVSGHGTRINGETAVRRFLGRMFNLLVQALLLPGLTDTQCGLKGFEWSAALLLFTRQRVWGFAFDVEILTLARAWGLDLVQVPVQAVDCPGSSVNRVLSPLLMAWDLLRVKTCYIFNLYGLPRQNLGAEVLLATGLFAAALLVRLPWLWQVPRYIDELKEVNLAYAIYTGQVLPLHNVAHDIGSLHNFILAGIFKLFGPNIYWPRFYVAVTAALTVVAVYHLGRRLFDRWTGLLAAGLLLTNGMHMMVTHMAWSNCTTPLFFSLALLALVKAEQEKSGRWLVLAALLWAAALQTHSSVIIYVVVALIYVLAPPFRHRTGIGWRWYLAGTVVFLAGYANMIYYNLVTRGGSIAWLSHKSYALEAHPGPASFIHNLGQMTVELLRAVSSTYTLQASLTAYLTHPFFLAALLTLGVGLLLAIRAGRTLPAWMMLGGMLVIPWLNHRYSFYLATRYIMPLIICALLYMAYAATSLLRAIAHRVSDVRTVMVPATAVVALLLVLQVIPFYRYCARINSSNLSNQLALHIMSVVSREGGEGSLVLLDQDLPLENRPLPCLLNISQQKYVMIPHDGSREWLTELQSHSNRHLIAVLSFPTYLRLKPYLPTERQYSFVTRVDFPRPLSSSRRVVVVEMGGGSGYHVSHNSHQTSLFGSLVYPR